VRQVVGYDRFTGELAYRQLTELYRALRVYVNCFQPSMKLHTKQREGSKVRRTYDRAQTPMQRLLASDAVPPNKQQELLQVTQALDPLRLLGQLEQLQKALFHAPVFCQAGDFRTGSCRWHSWDCPLAAQKGAQKKVSKKWTAP